jgi:hypothetical protein
MELIQIVIRNTDNETSSGWMLVCYATAVLNWGAAQQGVC